MCKLHLFVSLLFSNTKIRKNGLTHFYRTLPVPSANGVNYYLALNKNGVRSSLHVFPSGGHGWGCKVGFRYHAEMMMALKAWLRSF